MNLRSLLSAAALALVFAGTAAAQFDDPSPEDFAARMRALRPAAPVEERLQAVGWLNGHSAHKHAPSALPALEQCVRKDADPTVRARATESLGLIAHRHQKACPVVLLDALFDPVDEVRWTAMNYAGLFQTFPPEAEKILRRAAGADDGWLRENSLYLLPTAIGKKALPVIEKAKQDRLFLVRHSAHIAAFKLNGRFEEYLRYLIRLRDDPDGVLAPEPDDPKLRDEEKAQRNLAALGAAIRFIEWSDTRGEELARTLEKLLDDASPVIRCGAAQLIGPVAVHRELPKQPAFPWQDSGAAGSPFILPGEPRKPEEPKKPEPPRLSKAGKHLARPALLARLRKIEENDADEKVRSAAADSRNQLRKLMSQQP